MASPHPASANLLRVRFVSASIRKRLTGRLHEEFATLSLEGISAYRSPLLRFLFFLLMVISLDPNWGLTRTGTDPAPGSASDGRIASASEALLILSDVV